MILSKACLECSFYVFILIQKGLQTNRSKGRAPQVHTFQCKSRQKLVTPTNGCMYSCKNKLYKLYFLVLSSHTTAEYFHKNSCCNSCFVDIILVSNLCVLTNSIMNMTGELDKAHGWNQYKPTIYTHC